MVKIIGFHGTDARNVSNIKANNFRLSLGDQEWLGDGIYFFVDGICHPTPKNNAVKWAIASAWDNTQKRNTYNEYSILEVEIEENENFILDLCTVEGMKIYNYLRNKYIEKIVQAGVKLVKRPRFRDGEIINSARKNKIFPINIVKGNFYIKFANERKFDISFRIPNTTIIAVYDVNTIKKITEIHKKPLPT